MTTCNFKLLVTVITVIYLNVMVRGHGMMLDPLNRASLWRKYPHIPADYDDDGIFCGGFNVQIQNKGKCGVCGDNYLAARPRPHELGGTFGSGKIVSRYVQNSTIKVKIQLTTNHRGWFKFNICNLDKQWKKPEVESTTFRREEKPDSIGEVDKNTIVKLEEVKKTIINKVNITNEINEITTKSNKRRRIITNYVQTSRDSRTPEFRVNKVETRPKKVRIPQISKEKVPDNYGRFDGSFGEKIHPKLLRGNGNIVNRRVARDVEMSKVQTSQMRSIHGSYGQRIRTKAQRIVSRRVRDVDGQTNFDRDAFIKSWGTFGQKQSKQPGSVDRTHRELFWSDFDHINHVLNENDITNNFTPKPVVKYPLDLETEQCFEGLRLANGKDLFWVDPERNVFTVEIKLPEELRCDHCVFRWYYRTGNNWGVCKNGLEAEGCGPQETFINCADVTIHE